MSHRRVIKIKWKVTNWSRILIKNYGEKARMLIVQNTGNVFARKNQGLSLIHLPKQKTRAFFFKIQTNYSKLKGEEKNSAKNALRKQCSMIIVPLHLYCHQKQNGPSPSNACLLFKASLTVKFCDANLFHFTYQ